MITTTALSFHYPYFLKIQIMTILTRQEGEGRGRGGERERLVIDLYYNQGKTYREISKVARISPSDIGVILNKIEDQRMERRATK